MEVSDFRELDEVAGQAAAGLARDGWWAGEGLLEPALVSALAAELDALIADDRLHRAGIGREDDFQVDRAIRRDRVRWLGGRSAAEREYLLRMEALRVALNRHLFLGLFEFEAHFSHYPQGAFYRRHFDSFRGARNRLVSTVSYLTAGWRPGDGGELVLYPEDGDGELARIAPRSGTVALFLSEEIPHEVLPALRDRYSIAGWFRLNASVGGQIDPPR